LKKKASKNLWVRLKQQRVIQGEGEGGRNLEDRHQQPSILSKDGKSSKTKCNETSMCHVGAGASRDYVEILERNATGTRKIAHYGKIQV